ELELLAQIRERFRLLHAIQILTLQVLHQRHLCRLLCRYPLHQRRNRSLPRDHRCPQPTLTQNQDEPPISSLTHRNRLQNSLHLNRICQLPERFLIKLPSRLVRIPIDQIDFQKKHRLPIRRNSRCRSLQRIDLRSHVLRGNGRPPEPALSGVEGSVREFSRRGRKR